MDASIKFTIFLFSSALGIFSFSSLYGEASDANQDSTRYKYISINPGVTLESITVNIEGRNRDALMVQDGPGRVSWILDLKSPEYQISKYFGMNLMLHNSSFFLDRQSIPRAFSRNQNFSDPSESSSSGGSSGTGTGNQNNRVTEDLNTNISGTYSMLVPIFYVGNPDTFRFGLGFGPSQVRIRGNVDFLDAASNLVLAFSSSDRNEFLNNVSAVQLVSGNLNPSADPILTYLLLNLSTGNNLELTGVYLASQGLLRPDLAALSALASGQYSPVEALALSSLLRSQVSVNARAKFAFMFYIESPPFLNLRARISFGGPIVEQNGYTYEFRTFHLALYRPIEF